VRVCVCVFVCVCVCDLSRQILHKKALACHKTANECVLSYMYRRMCVYVSLCMCSVSVCVFLFVCFCLCVSVCMFVL